jgi:DNA-binding response OmpR family regulator
MISFSDTEKGGRNLKVLVVEDEVMVGLLAEDILQVRAHTVIGPIARLEKAVEAARRETVDLAMLDINLDGQETFPVAEILAAGKIPVMAAARLAQSDQIAIGRPQSLDAVDNLKRLASPQARLSGPRHR